jgi:hypothetical protein
MLTQKQQLIFAKSSEATESQVLFGPPALRPAESPNSAWSREYRRQYSPWLPQV